MKTHVCLCASVKLKLSCTVCVNRSDAELVDSQPGMCAEEEIIELGLEFTRTWEFEQVDTQITDVHGQLLRNVTFWEQALHAPTNY